MTSNPQAPIREVPVTEIIQGHWRNATSTLGADENARRLFLRDGSAPAVGDVFRNPDLAKALRLVAAGGAPRRRPRPSR